MTMQSLLRRFSVALLLVIASAAPLAAQGGEDDYDFSDIPVEEEEIPYIGVGGGYQLMLTLLNTEPLDVVSGSLGMPDVSGQLFMHGGGGFAAIGIIPNVRVGVYGGAGSKQVNADTSLDGVAYDRSLRFTSGYTGAHIDYAIPVLNKLTVAPGVLIGGGSTAIDYAQTQTPATFENLFGPQTARGANEQTSMLRTYFFAYPVLNIEYAMTQFILLRIGGGYMYGFGEKTEWENGHGAVITGVPEVSADGPTFTAGLFLGLFQQ